MSAKKATQKSAKSTTASNKKSKGFTAEERAAMKERAQELKAEARKADGESALLAKVAEMPEPDRAIAKRLHAIVKASAPGLYAENLVRDARVCQGRQGRLLLPKRGQVQVEVRDSRLQRRGEPRRRRHVADLLRAEGVDPRRRDKDPRAREESGELSEEAMKTSKILHRSAVRIALGVVLVLSLPLVAMLFTDEVVWSLADFVVAGILLATIGVALELALRKAGNLAAALGIAALGVAAAVLGEADDAPGLVLLGILLIASAFALGVRTAQR